MSVRDEFWILRNGMGSVQKCWHFGKSVPPGGRRRNSGLLGIRFRLGASAGILEFWAIGSAWGLALEFWNFWESGSSWEKPSEFWHLGRWVPQRSNR